MKSDLILGIDLGTTNSLVGVVDSGFPILLADADGNRITPSAVFFPDDGPVEIGRSAIRQYALAPDRCVLSIKRKMGASDDLVRLPDGRSVSAEEVSAHILRHLKKIAEDAMEQPCHKAVITVPAYFNDAQRAATKRAGELAGLEVVRILNEPTAAGLAYGLDRHDEESKFAVYDLGGGTFDISIIELKGGVFRVLSTCGDTMLGGDDLDFALAEEIKRRLQQEFGPDVAIPSQLKEVAQAAKVALSEKMETTIRLPFFSGGSSFETTVSRDKFEALVQPILEKTRPLCRRAMADANVAPEDLQKVILVGGSTRMPAVRALVKDIFRSDPDISQNPDEAVAMGAVIQAGVLSGSIRNVLLLDVTPLSLGIETFGGLMNVLIPRNTTIPTKRGEMFTNAVTNQSSMAIRILQGERELARDNWQLGAIDLPFPPAAKGQARVGVQFEIDADGILTVLARDTATMRDEILKIDSSAVDVDDEKVERMIEESVAHAFDDMAARRWTEAEIKARELLQAVAQARKLVPDDFLPQEESEAIEMAEAALQSALAGSDLSRLQAANDALDQATETLAARIVDSL